MVNQIESLKNLNQDQKRILLNVIINIQKKDTQELEKNLIKLQENNISININLDQVEDYYEYPDKLEIDSSSEYERNFLGFLQKYPSIPIIKLLIKYGIDINAIDEYSFISTPLHLFFSASKKFKLVRYIFKLVDKNKLNNEYYLIRDMIKKIRITKNKKVKKYIKYMLSFIKPNIRKYVIDNYL